MPANFAQTQSAVEMKVGMLWFDNNDQQSLDGKISKAAAYYKKKYGRMPSLCYIHPSMLNRKPDPDNGSKIHSGKIEVRFAPWVLPNHYWIGNEGED